MKKKLIVNLGKILFATTFWVVILAIITGISYYSKPTAAVLSTSQEIQVSASVYGCVLDVTIHPEKRMPSINNWGTILTVSIFDANSTNLKGTITTTTDSSGHSTVNICSQGYYLSSGNYDFYLRGYSHLTKKFSNIASFNGAQTSLNFTSSPDQELLAGETSNIFDNKINSLDLATQINAHIIYTNNYKNDLNQDGIVNSLDISNTITNFYKVGD